MIILDKRKEQQRVIVTVSENSSSLTAEYELKIHSAYSNKTYSLSLPDNTSSFVDRYDEFLIDTSSIAQWENGFYDYSIKEVDGEVIEIGSLQIIDGVLPPFISIEHAETKDDFIVYKK